MPFKEGYLWVFGFLMLYNLLVDVMEAVESLEATTQSGFRVGSEAISRGQLTRSCEPSSTDCAGTSSLILRYVSFATLSRLCAALEDLLAISAVLKESQCVERMGS